MPKGTTYNTVFFTDAVMPSLIENVQSRTGRKTSKSWLVHMDSARLHNFGGTQRCTEASRAERLPHPVDSPDLASYDFFLFRYIKGQLFDYNCERREDLLNAITEVFTRVDQDMLVSVFEFWANRLRSVIKHKGKHSTQLR
jgi:hypothetical protein